MTELTEIRAFLATEWAQTEHVTGGGSSSAPSYSTLAVRYLREALAARDAALAQLVAERQLAAELAAELVQAADRLAVEVAELREALIESVKYDDGTFMQIYKRCRVCLWSERDTDVTEHQDYCILTRPADGRGAAIVQAADRLATVLDVEIMPRYRELFEALGVGDFSQSVAGDVATEALDRWRFLVPERAGEPEG